MNDRLTVWLTDWLTDWFTHSLTHSFTYIFTDVRMLQLIHSPISAHSNPLIHPSTHTHVDKHTCTHTHTNRYTHTYRCTQIQTRKYQISHSRNHSLTSWSTWDNNIVTWCDDGRIIAVKNSINYLLDNYCNKVHHLETERGGRERERERERERA